MNSGCINRGVVDVLGCSNHLIPDENGVIKLNKANFDQALQQYPPLLIHFYAPLSGESMGSIMEFSKAAAHLRDSGDVIKLGGVDVSKEKELAKELNVTAIPCIRLYLSIKHKHHPLHCPALRDAEAILTWLKRREGPSADVIETLSQLEDFIKSHDLSVLGLYKGPEEGLVQIFFSTAADVADLPFATLCSSSDRVRWTVPLEVSSDITKDALTDFIRIHELQLVTEYNGKTAPQILNSVLKNHLVLFINKTEETFTHTLAQFQSTAAQFRGQVLFVMIDTDEPRNGRVLEFFRGKAKPRLQSEPIPHDWDKLPVKELVGLNFEPVVFNDKNNVLVLFYAPWSEESRALFPLWEELAQRYSNHDNVVVARIDVTANDVNILMLDKPPSIKLFPALYAQRVVPYEGERSVDAVLEFMQEEMRKAKKDKAKEERERRKYVEKVKAAEAAEKEAAKKKEEL
ncbi:hypothetical protein ACEWY4_017503 [Coilia grayii]|uniref:Thioredoxin domain-containing protein n=1 Tax=Coilia grayii TaxID=363190 RepID=A0ABD1JHA1_9TELE